MPTSVHEQFDDAQKDAIRQSFLEGSTRNELAKIYGVPPRTMGKLLHSMELTRSRSDTAKMASRPKWDGLIDKVRELRQTHSLPELSKLLNVPISSLQRICTRHGVAVPADYAERQSVRMKAAWAPEKRAEIAKRSRELVTPELRQLLRQSSLALWGNPEYRANQVATQSEIWNRPENKARLAEFRASQSGKVSSIQRALYDVLNDLGIEYEPEFVLGPYNFDCKVGNLLIECQGDYWHGLEKAVRIDKAKATYVNTYFADYRLHYLWEHQFHCRDQVTELLKYWTGKTSFELVEFKFEELEIRQALAEDYKPLLLKYHYLPNAGRGGISYGAYIGNELIAVCVFSPLLRQNVDVGDHDPEAVRELSRLCVHPRYQKRNLASWFVSRCIKLLDAKYRAVISYCDTTFNHDGAVYKALNFKQDKVIRPDYWYVDETGWVMHKKTLYQRAVKMSLLESEYAERFGYKRVYGTEKLRFILER